MGPFGVYRLPVAAVRAESPYQSLAHRRGQPPRSGGIIVVAPGSLKFRVPRISTRCEPRAPYPGVFWDPPRATAAIAPRPHRNRPCTPRAHGNFPAPPAYSPNFPIVAMPLVLPNPSIGSASPHRSPNRWTHIPSSPQNATVPSRRRDTNKYFGASQRLKSRFSPVSSFHHVQV